MKQIARAKNAMGPAFQIPHTLVEQPLRSLRTTAKVRTARSVSNCLYTALRLVLTDAFRGAGDAQRNSFICRTSPQSALFSGTSKLVGTAPLQNWDPSREPSRL